MRICNWYIIKKSKCKMKRKGKKKKKKEKKIMGMVD